MPFAPYALWAAVIAQSVVSGSPSGTAGVDTDTEIIQTAANHGSRMTVPVAVHGRGPYHFLIDTGSQRTVVSTAIAGTLGLVQGPRVRVVGMAGEDNVRTAWVDSLGFGTRQLSGLSVPLLEDRHIGADGILGTDSLQGQRVVLDFTRNTIAIGSASEVGGNGGYEITVRARKRSGRLIMTNARIDGIRVDVVIDTGASGTIGNLALQHAMRNRPRIRSMLTSVTGQTLATDIGFARMLSIDGLRASNVMIAFADAPAFGELGLQKRPAIFLGMREMRAFERIAIDFSSRRILFDLEGRARARGCPGPSPMSCAY